MKLSLVPRAALACVLFAAPFFAALHAELPVEVSEVLEANLTASGGRDVIGAIESSRLKGSISIAAIGLSGTTEMVMKSPDKLYVVQEIPGVGKMVQAYDGEIGWANDAMQGFRHLSAGEIASLKQNDSFSDMLNYEKTYSAGVRLEDAEVDGELTTVVKLTSAVTGLEQTCYYSKDSNLLFRMDMVVDMGAMGQIPASMSIKSYQETAGVVFPAVMEMTNAGMVIRVTFDSLELNIEIEDSLFAAPQ